MRNFVSRAVSLAALLALGVVCNLAMAVDPVITPPVDIASYISGGITAMAAVVVAAIIGWFGFKVVKKGLSWASRGLG